MTYALIFMLGCVMGVILTCTVVVGGDSDD